MAALAVIGAAFTPVSLPGDIADHILLGLAYAVLWLALGASPSLVRYSALGVFSALVVVPLVQVWPIVVGIFVLGDVTRPPVQTLHLDCRQTVRMYGYGWVGNSGTKVVVVRRPLGLPVEVELGRRLFDDLEYETAGLSARSTRDVGGTCGVAVTYSGADVWSVK